MSAVIPIVSLPDFSTLADLDLAVLINLHLKTTLCNMLAEEIKCTHLCLQLGKLRNGQSGDLRVDQWQS